jgi:hypothetical protein
MHMGFGALGHTVEFGNGWSTARDGSANKVLEINSGYLSTICVWLAVAFVRIIANRVLESVVIIISPNVFHNNDKCF